MKTSVKILLVFIIIAVIILATNIEKYINTKYETKSVLPESKSNDTNSANSDGVSVALIPTIKPPTFAKLSSLFYSDSGIISAGKTFIKITNVGDADGTINVGNGDRILAVGEYWKYPDYQTSTPKLTYQVLFDATGTNFLIETEE